MKHDPYNCPAKLESSLKCFKNDHKVSKENKRIVLEYKDECLAQGLTLGRIARCIYVFRYFATVLNKSFKKADIKDIKAAVAELEASKYADSTKAEMKVTLKKFYNWLRGYGPKTYPPEVVWIKNTKKNGHKLPEDMLTEDDIKAMINAADNLRDKAFIAVLAESGCRISELLGLKIKHVRFDKYGAQLTVDGKTGMRYVRIISSVPYITQWMNDHPKKDDIDACLWLSKRKGNHALSYSRTKALLNQLKARSGVKRAVNPHNFRHSRATFLANYLSDAQLKQHFGWTQSSRMASVYIHMSGRDVDKALLKINGIEIDKTDDNKSSLDPKNCMRCETVNPSTNKFCSKCGFILDEKTMIETIENDLKLKKSSDILDRMLNDPDFAQMFKEKAEKIIGSA
ncbi:MAG: tyrosine-type recombinase/integrase [Candidatus Aenigmarchaeota archaeon]|nr:tyrosine-type recombinase/integrase [Candidatus Aenigmarchaeota archaeon]